MNYELSQLITEIKNYLKNDSVKYNRFYKCLRDYLTSAVSDESVIVEILDILSENERLLIEVKNKIESYKNESVDIRGSTNKMIKFIQNNFAERLNEKINIRIKNLITMVHECLIRDDIFIEAIDSLLGGMSEELNYELKDLTKLLCYSSLENRTSYYKNLMNPKLSISYLPPSLAINTYHRLPPILTFIAAISAFDLSEIVLTSLFKCLRLYSLDLINISMAIDWIKSLHPAIFREFMGVATISEPKVFSPMYMSVVLHKYIPHDTITELFAPLNSILEESKKIALDKTVEGELYKSHGDITSDNQISYMFLDMQITKAFEIYSYAVKEARRGADVESEKIGNFFKLLFSKNEIDIKTLNIPIFIREFTKEKFESIIKYHKAYIKSFNSKHNGGVFLSVDWRTLYFNYMKRDTVYKRIVLEDQDIQIDGECFNIVYEVLSEIYKEVSKKAKFESTSYINPVDYIIGIKGSTEKKFATRSFAMALYYYAKIVELVVDYKNKDGKIENISEIPGLIFRNHPPYADKFPESNLCNVDVPIANFLKLVGRFREKESIECHCSSQLSQIVAAPNEKADELDDFIFKVKVTENNVMIKSLINPFTGK